MATKTVKESREEKRAEREQRRLEREMKRADREARKAALVEKRRIAKLPPVKVTPVMVKNVLNMLDPDGKFSAGKRANITNKVKQIGALAPRTIIARLKARKFQVEMIGTIYDEVMEASSKGKKGTQKKEKK